MNYIIEGSKWTKREITIVKKMYPAHSEEKILKKLPGRGWRSVCYMAQKMKFKRKLSLPNGWTQAQIKLLIKKYPTTNTRLLQRSISRSRPAIIAMAMKLKLRKEGRNYTPKSRKDVKPNFWSEKEIDILKKYYEKSSKEKLVKLLPKRKWGSIISQANKNKLTRNNKWTEKELKIIEKYYIPWTREKLEKHLPGRSWGQIIKKYAYQNVGEY